MKTKIKNAILAAILASSISVFTYGCGGGSSSSSTVKSDNSIKALQPAEIIFNKSNPNLSLDGKILFSNIGNPLNFDSEYEVYDDRGNPVAKRGLALRDGYFMVQKEDLPIIFNDAPEGDYIFSAYLISRKTGEHFYVDYAGDVTVIDEYHF